MAQHQSTLFDFSALEREAAACATVSGLRSYILGSTETPRANVNPPPLTTNTATRRNATGVESGAVRVAPAEPKRPRHNPAPVDATAAAPTNSHAPTPVDAAPAAGAPSNTAVAVGSLNATGAVLNGLEARLAALAAAKAAKAAAAGNGQTGGAPK